MAQEVKIPDNGASWIAFGLLNGLVIGGTLFPHKEGQKRAWRYLDGVTENQIVQMAFS